MLSGFGITFLTCSKSVTKAVAVRWHLVRWMTAETGWSEVK